MSEHDQCSPNRGRYATDASFYQIMPAGVVVPRTVDEALRTLAIVRDAGRIVTPRGGGTSQNGQPIGDGLVLDMSRHFNGVTDYDPQARTVRVRPGTVLTTLNDQLRKDGLFFQPTVMTGVRDDAKVATEETFGPLAPLFRFETEEEAIDKAKKLAAD